MHLFPEVRLCCLLPLPRQNVRSIGAQVTSWSPQRSATQVLLVGIVRPEDGCQASTCLSPVFVCKSCVCVHALLHCLFSGTIDSFFKSLICAVYRRHKGSPCSLCVFARRCALRRSSPRPLLLLVWRCWVLPQASWSQPPTTPKNTTATKFTGATAARCATCQTCSAPAAIRPGHGHAVLHLTFSFAVQPCGTWSM